MDTIGWLGSVLLALCGLPQAILAIKEGHSKGISWWFLGMWGVGEVLVLVYILPLNQVPLILNYAVNIVFVAIILKYKIKPRV